MKKLNIFLALLSLVSNMEGQIAFSRFYDLTINYESNGANQVHENRNFYLLTSYGATPGIGDVYTLFLDTIEGNVIKERLESHKLFDHPYDYL